MKKLIFAILLSSILLLTACGGIQGPYLTHGSHVTQMPYDYIFEINEEVQFSRKNPSIVSQDPWATVEIKNAIILAEDPEDLDDLSNNQEFQAIVQINYQLINNEPDIYDIRDSDFLVFDAQGNKCRKLSSSDIPCNSVYTAYDSIVVAVPVKSDHLDIKIALDPEETEPYMPNDAIHYATIRCYYGVGDTEVSPDINNNMIGAIFWITIAIALALAIAIPLLIQKRLHTRELSALKAHFSPEQKPIFADGSHQIPSEDQSTERMDAT